MSEPDFRERLEPLRAAAEQIAGEDTSSRVPFVLVVTRDLVSPYDAVPLLHLAGSDKPGQVDRNHGEGDLAGYHPIEGCEPPGAAYLLVGVERGEEFCNVRPEDATRTIRGRGRTPLTIDEGIALVTQLPKVLEKNKCFMLAGSRRHGSTRARAVDQRARTEARLVLGRQPAHVAGHCVRR